MNSQRTMVLKKIALLAAKIAFALGAIALILYKIDIQKLGNYFKTIHPLYIITAFAFLNLGQIFSAARTQYYLHSKGLTLSFATSTALYYIGTFFNVLLPGGIGGDGYKVYLLKKEYDFPLLAGSRVMISGRANGLLLLIMIAGFLGLFSLTLPKIVPHVRALIIASLCATAITYALIAKTALKEPYNVQLKGSLYSLGVQVTVLLTSVFLFMGLGEEAHWAANGHWVDYLMLFMLSCVVSVLPVSLGCVGLRELTFFYGAPMLGLNTELGIAVSFMYFIINLGASFIGLGVFLHRKRVSVADMPVPSRP